MTKEVLIGLVILIVIGAGLWWWKKMIPTPPVDNTVTPFVPPGPSNTGRPDPKNIGGTK